MARPFESTSDPNETDEAREVRLRAESDIAFQEGRFDDAFNLMQQAGLDEAIRWFREEGVTFTKNQPEITPLELIIGLASATHGEITERGDATPHRLTAAAGYLWALAELRIALDHKTGRVPSATGPKLAEVTMRAAVLGEMAGTVNAVRLGLIDKLSEFDRERERRRAGAALANEKKATAKERAFSEALRIIGRNATLSNEELALKLRESLKPNTTVKTLSTWAREWRRKGILPAQKKL